MSKHLTILYEDNDLLAVQKPAGRLVHAAPDVSELSVEDEIRANHGKKYVLLHRLDRETSGVLLFAKGSETVKSLADQFAHHNIRKVYWAVVSGQWPKQVTRVELKLAAHPHGGQRIVSEGEAGLLSRSTMRILASNSEKTWLEVLPKTGRTHQVRLHCLSQGHPILGDPRYGTPHAQMLDSKGSMALHARSLALRHPRTHAPLVIVAPLPSYWRTWLSGFAYPKGCDEVAIFETMKEEGYESK